MSGFEVEGYIFTGTLLVSYLIKSGKWIVEELIDLVLLWKKLRTTIKGPALTEIQAVNPSLVASQATPRSEHSDSRAA